MKNFILWNNHYEYELKCRIIARDSFYHTKQCKIWMISAYDQFSRKYSDLNVMLDKIESGELVKPDGIIRKDEHGILWGRELQWMNTIKRCYDMGILPMSHDFGYFSHYNSLMVDIYNKDGSSSILNEWDKLSDEVNWEEVPKYIKKYRDRFFKFYNRAKNKPPPKNLKSGEFVVIWMQSFLDLIRPEFRTDGWVEKTEVSDWINRLSQMILDMGLTPVVKGCPGAWRRVDISSIKNAMVFTDLTEHIKPFPSAIHDEQINYKLIAHAKFHVLSHTSATNMLVLANAPTITMGRSWFTGLDIFNEPKTWDMLLSNPMYINQKNRNKWINWWLSKQVPKEEVINKFMETHDKYAILTNK